MTTCYTQLTAIMTSGTPTVFVKRICFCHKARPRKSNELECRIFKINYCVVITVSAASHPTRYNSNSSNAEWRLFTVAKGGAHNHSNQDDCFLHRADVLESSIFLSSSWVVLLSSRKPNGSDLQSLGKLLSFWMVESYHVLLRLKRALIP